VQLRIAVDRKALELNKRITDLNQHHPPIIIEQDDGRVAHAFDFPLMKNRTWRIVYRPDTPWIEIMDDGEPMAFNVWIQDDRP